MSSKRDPQVGDVVTLVVWVDRKQTKVPATVTRVIYWMDNSVEVIGTALDDGREVSSLVVMPHGDVCF